MSRQDNRRIKKSARIVRNSRGVASTNPRRDLNSKAAIKKISAFNVFILAIIFITVFTYIIRAAYTLVNKSEIITGEIVYGSVDLPEIIDGIIIRDEKVYKAEVAGAVKFNYSDQDRIKKGSVACVITDEEASAQISESLNQINSRILDVQSMRNDYSIFSADVELKNRQLKKMIDDSIPKFVDNNLSALYEFKDNLEQTVNIRNQMLLSESRGSLKDMVDEKAVFDSKLDELTSSITITASGIISYIVDGLEETLTVEALDSVTREKTRMDIDYSKLAARKNVEAGDPVFKIIQSNEWYMAAYIPQELIFDWQQDTTKTIYVDGAGSGDGFTPLEVQVNKITKGEKFDYVVFKCSKGLLDYINRRRIRIKTLDSAIKGYKIPKAAIVDRTFLKIPKGYISEEEGASYIIRRTNNVDEKLKVIKLKGTSEDEEFSYVLLDYNILKIADTIVSIGDPQVVYVTDNVENIKGVYRINQGYAEFCKVAIDESTPEIGGYCILDTAKNKSIKISDRIVLDAKNIQEGQIIN